MYLKTNSLGIETSEYSSKMQDAEYLQVEEFLRTQSLWTMHSYSFKVENFQIASGRSSGRILLLLDILLRGQHHYWAVNFFCMEALFYLITYTLLPECTCTLVWLTLTCVTGKHNSSQTVESSKETLQKKKMPGNEIAKSNTCFT